MSTGLPLQPERQRVAGACLPTKNFPSEPSVCHGENELLLLTHLFICGRISV